MNSAIITPINKKKDFRDLICAYMGYEAALTYDEILKDIELEIDEMYGSGQRTPEGADSWEAIADEWRELLVDTMNNLNEVLEKSKLDRKKITEIYKKLYDVL